MRRQQREDLHFSAFHYSSRSVCLSVCLSTTILDLALQLYIELLPLQRILQSNQIAEQAKRHEIKWGRLKIIFGDSEICLSREDERLSVFVEVLVSIMCSLSVVKWLVESQNE